MGGRPSVATIAGLALLAALAAASLGWGSFHALTSSADLMRRADEADLFVRRIDPYRDPDMTYPPSAPAILAPFVAPFGPTGLRATWLAGNLAALGVVAGVVARRWGRTRGRASSAAILLCLAAMKPTRLCLGMGQFALIPVALMLVAAFLPRRRDRLAGVLMGVALIKPTMALPMVGFFAVRGRWGVIAVAALVQGASAIAGAAWVRASPLDQVREWLALARGQQAAGLVDVPSLMQMIDPASAAISGPVTLAILIAGFAATYLLRGRSDRSIASFCLLVAAVFAYHRPYDLVLLIPATATLAEAGARRGARSAAAVLAALATAALILPNQPIDAWVGPRPYPILIVVAAYGLAVGLVVELVRERPLVVAAGAPALAVTATPSAAT